MITVRMLKTQKGSVDGVHLRVYCENRLYDLPEELAFAFIYDLKCAKETVRGSLLPIETPEGKIIQ